MKIEKDYLIMNHYIKKELAKKLKIYQILIKMSKLIHLKKEKGSQFNQKNKIDKNLITYVLNKEKIKKQNKKF